MQGAVMALVLLAAGIAICSVTRERAAAHLQATETYEHRYYLPERELLPVLSLGYQRALADLIWMRALVYFGDEMQHRSGVEHVFAYTEAILALDPDFREVYTWVGVAGLYRPRMVTREEIEQVVAIQRRGLKRFPDDGKLMWEVAGNLSFELLRHLKMAGDTDAIQAAEREASELMLGAAARGAAPDYVVLGSASTLQALGQKDRAIEQLQKMYALVDDEDIRQSIAARLRALRGEQAQNAIAADLEQLQMRWRAERAWIPLAFYGLVAPSPEERFLDALSGTPESSSDFVEDDAATGADAPSDVTPESVPDSESEPSSDRGEVSDRD